MPDKDTWINSLQSLKVSENLSQQAADILSRQDAGELPYPLPEKEQHVVTRVWRCFQIKQVIEARIERNHTEGVQFMEGQMLPHGITLEVACELAELWVQGMNDEALEIISQFPQHEIIARIYRACAGIESQHEPSTDDDDIDFSELFDEEVNA